MGAKQQDISNGELISFASYRQVRQFQSPNRIKNVLVGSHFLQGARIGIFDFIFAMVSSCNHVLNEIC